MLKETVFSVDILQLTLPDGTIRNYPLNSAGGVTNIGRHSDNDIVIDSPDAKPFHFVLDHQDLPFQLIALRETEAAADELELVLEKIGELHYNESFEIGQYRFHLLRSESKKELTPASIKKSLPDEMDSISSAPARTATLAYPPSVKNDSFLDLNLPLHEWILKANESTVYDLLVSNPTNEDITCAISVTGLIASSITISPNIILLRADERAKVILSCLLPKEPSNRAGVHPLTIEVSSTEDKEQVSRRKIVVRIQPFYAFSVASLEPEEQSLPFLRPQAEVIMKITNRSNCEANFHVTGFALGSACRFNFKLPGTAHAKQANLRLGANENLSLPVQIEPPVKAFFGIKAQSYHFGLRTTMLTGRTRKEPTYYTIGGHFKSQPLIGPFTGIAAGLLFFSILLFFYPHTIEQTYTQLLSASNESPIAIEATNLPTEATQQWQTSQLAVVATVEPTTHIVENHSLITYEAMFKQIAAKYNLDWKLLASIAYRESTLNPSAMGQDNDMGLMQIIPLTWNEVAQPLGVSDPYDPYSNVLVGATYLAQLRDHFVSRGYSDVRLILVSYNWGVSNVEGVLQNGGGWNEFPASTQQYAQYILQVRDGGFPPEMDALLQRLINTP